MAVDRVSFTVIQMMRDERMRNESLSKKMQKPVPFWKMSGSGNDFVVLDNRQGLVPETVKSDWARLVCRRRVAVGADGVVFIDTLDAAGMEAADIRWRYFNADGSEGEMCGNGAMCGARFVIEQGIAPNPVRMLTASGVVRASLDGVRVWISIPPVSPVEMTIDVPGLPIAVKAHRVTVGVPHVVVPVEDADNWPPAGTFDELGWSIRHHPLFAPAGTNVNVVSWLPEGGVRMRTWERGVEAETLACGTGAVASAIVATLLGAAGSPVSVQTSSGQVLMVEFEMNGTRADEVRLGGEASVIAVGEILPDAWTEMAEERS